MCGRVVLEHHFFKMTPQGKGVWDVNDWESKSGIGENLLSRWLLMNWEVRARAASAIHSDSLVMESSKFTASFLMVGSRRSEYRSRPRNSAGGCHGSFFPTMPFLVSSSLDDEPFRMKDLAVV